MVLVLRTAWLLLPLQTDHPYDGMKGVELPSQIHHSRHRFRLGNIEHRNLSDTFLLFVFDTAITPYSPFFPINHRQLPNLQIHHNHLHHKIPVLCDSLVIL